MKFAGTLFIVIIFLPLFIFSQTQHIRVVDDKQYIKINDGWHTTINQNPGSLIDTSHIIVKFKSDYSIDDINFSSLGLPLLKNVRSGLFKDFYELSVPPDCNAFIALDKLKRSGLFENVHFNLIGEITLSPNDYYYKDVFKHWNLLKINMPGAWDITTGSSNIIVAVIDNGVQYDHPDLSSNKWSGIGYDFYSMDNDPSPDNIAEDYNNYHGTAVTGVICSQLNNQIGTAGIGGGWNSLKGVSFMSLRSGLNRKIDIWAAANSIIYATNHGAKVINCSFKIDGASPEEYLEFDWAISYAISRDVLIVCASGNADKEKPKLDVHYPASHINTLAVGASTELDMRKDFDDGTDEPLWGSCYGVELDVVAPGIHIPTTDYEGVYGKSPADYYLSFSGTSAASPHASALAALIFSINPTLKWYEVRDIIRNNADKVGGYQYSNGFNEEMGFGRINVLRALDVVPLPLSVNISGPTWLDNYEYGTFTANPSGGSGSYVDYKWWSRNDEGIITPLSLTGGVEPNAPLPGLWNQVSSWDGLSTVTPGYNWDFSLKCEVTDSEGQTATDIHSVIVGEPLLATSQQNREMAISAVPVEFLLQGNYPNPFNPVTTIRFGLPEAANVKLVIYSITGAKVATLVDGYLSEGYHEAQWNGLNQAGARVASGIYIYELTSGGKRFIKKMLLAK